jgi:hypothetical protein
MTIKKRTRKIFSIKNKKQSMKKRETVKLQRQPSYSPTINKKLSYKLTTLTKRTDEFKCKDKFSVKVKISNPSDTHKKYRCYSYNTKPAQNQLLRFLNAEPKFNEIVAPKQVLSNCWFNAMFMCFFISDYGRKFLKAMRNMMITGIHPITKQPINDELHKSLFLLNRSIQESFDNTNTTLLNNTNKIISLIYNSLEQITNSNVDNSIRKKDQAGNPIQYLSALSHYIGFNNLNLYVLDTFLMSNEERKQSNLLFKDRMIRKRISKTHSIPDIVCVVCYDGQQTPSLLGDNIYIHTDEDANINKTTIQMNKKKTSNSDIQYVLDSSILTDIDKEHFSCFLTYKGREFYFDGFTKSRLIKKKWKHNIHKNRNMTFQTKKDVDFTPQQFNFQKGVRYLIYYRV